MATHSSILAWEIPWTEHPGGLQAMGCAKSRTRLSDYQVVAPMVKCLPAMRVTQVQSLGQEDLLEKEMATHSSILAWKIPWTVEPGPWGCKESDMIE